MAKLAFLIAYIVCGVLVIAFVMMHSGEGTGLSAGVRQSISGAAAAVAERNVNRITVTLSILFVILCFALSIAMRL